ncbi:hypothetical protein GINT2_001999 [Glugoides intestinalis]
MRKNRKSVSSACDSCIETDSEKENLESKKQPQNACVKKQPRLNYCIKEGEAFEIISGFEKQKTYEFDANTKDKLFAALLCLRSADLSGKSELFYALDQVCKSPYFLFVGEELRGIFLKAINNRVDLLKEAKLLVLECLSSYYNPIENFKDIIALYPSIDTFRVSNGSFRNSLLVKTLERIFKDYSERLLEALVVCFQHLGLCIPFVEYTCKHSENPLCRQFLILYCYDFLRNIKCDLLHIKSLDEVKDIDDSVISRIFYAIEDIKKAYENELDKIDGNSHITSECINTLIMSLFKADSIKSIIPSIYKRLFFFFLFKNKKSFQSQKVFNVFTKEDRAFIFKHIKTHRLSFINIFRQIDQRFLLAGLSISDLWKGACPDPSAATLITCIKEDKLDENDLKAFYELYFAFLEASRAPLKIQAKDLELFSVVFNSRLDKSFVRFIRIENTSMSLSSFSIINFLLAISIYSTSLIDPVLLVALITDDPPSIIRRTHIDYYNAVLKLILACSSILNPPLTLRLVPVLRRLLVYKDYTWNAGLLYRKLFDLYPFTGSLLSTDISLPCSNESPENTFPPFSLLIKAAINHPSFNDSLKDCFNQQRSQTPTKSADGSFANAVIFNSSFNHLIFTEYPLLIENVLKMKNQTTKNLLKVLNENPTGNASFITGNIALIQDLFFHFLILDSSSFSFPFESLLLEIFLEAFKIKAILPCMAIPYIIVRENSFYIYRNFLDNCLNCLPDCIFIICKRIRMVINTGGGDNGVDSNIISMLLESELKNNFLYQCSLSASLVKILEHIDYQNDLLIVYIILRYLQPFSKKEKELVIKHIAENVIDEKIFLLLENAKVFYEKHSKGLLPVNYLIDL